MCTCKLPWRVRLNPVSPLWLRLGWRIRRPRCRTRPGRGTVWPQPGCGQREPVGWERAQQWWEQQPLEEIKFLAGLFVCIWVHPYSSYGKGGGWGIGVGYFVGSLYVIGEGNQKLLIFCRNLLLDWMPPLTVLKNYSFRSNANQLVGKYNY